MVFVSRRTKRCTRYPTHQNSIAERIAVMAVTQHPHDSEPRAERAAKPVALDFRAVGRRISDIEAQLDVLAPQKSCSRNNGLRCSDLQPSPAVFAEPYDIPGTNA